MADRPEATRAAASVSAVVVNHDGGDEVVACVEALRSSRLPLRSILVVDNASTDGSRERLAEHFPEVEILALAENRGPAPGRNAGLERAETSHVLLVDDDVYPAAEALERLVRAQAATGAAVVVPRIVLHPGRDVVQCDGASAHFTGTMTLRHGFAPLASLSPEPAPVPVGAVISACMLVDRRAALEAGGFDPLYFLYFEDLEFSLRMRALGHELVCETAAVAYHDRGPGTPGLGFREGPYPALRARVVQRNRWMTVLIHYRWRTLLALAPALLAYEGASFVFCASRGHAGEWLRAWLSLARQLPQIRERRARLRRARKRRDVELIEGGPLPLAPGVLGSPLTTSLASRLSTAVDAYWRAAGRLAG